MSVGVAMPFPLEYPSSLQSEMYACDVHIGPASKTEHLLTQWQAVNSHAIHDRVGYRDSPSSVCKQLVLGSGIGQEPRLL